MVPHSPSVLNHVQALFPPEPSATFTAPTAIPPSLSLTRDDVAQVLASLPLGVGSGPSGLRFHHLKLLLDNPSELDLTRLLNTIIDPSCPTVLKNALLPGKLTCLSKPDGGVRPIIVRESLVRLLGKCLVKRFQPICLPLLSPFQFGVGRSSGADTVVHSTRAASMERDWPILLVDFSNAYGTVKRSEIAKILGNASIPAPLLAYFRIFYGSASPILHDAADRDQDLIMSSGVLQGCPLAPLFFSLAISNSLQACANALSNGSGFVSAYLDDVVICAPHDELATALSALTAAAKIVGLSVNTAKCKILAPPSNAGFVSPIPNIPVVTEGVTLLGAPLGSANFVRDFVTKRFEEIMSSIELLESFPSYQARYLFARDVIASKLSHLSRLTLPLLGGACIPEMNDKIDSAVGSLLRLLPRNSSFPPLQAAIFQLPIRNGGLGFRPSRYLQALDFLASIADSLRSLPADGSRHKMHLEAAIAGVFADSLKKGFEIGLKFCQEYEKHNPAGHALRDTLAASDLGKISKRSSKTFTHLAGDVLFQHATALAPDRYSKAQLLSCSQPGAGAYLQARPADSGLVMSNLAFILALRSQLQLPCVSWLHNQLSIPLPDSCPVCSCAASEPVPLTDRHALACAALSHYACHTALRDVTAMMACDANVTVQKEFTIDASRRTDVVFQGMGASGTDLHLDVSVIHPGEADLARAAVEPLSTAEKRSTLKRTKYATAVQQIGAQFLPFVFEAHGAFSTEVCEQIRRLSKRVNHEAPPQASWLAPSFSAYWAQRLSVALRLHTSMRYIQVTQRHVQLRDGLFGEPRGPPRALDANRILYLAPEVLVHTSLVIIGQVPHPLPPQLPVPAAVLIPAPQVAAAAAAVAVAAAAAVPPPAPVTQPAAPVSAVTALAPASHPRDAVARI